jgi:Ca2+-binding RTX toxin-like protein
LGYDNLYGGAGNDSLLGGKGNDFLSGDGGKDTLDGGAGRDWAAAYVDDNDTNGVTIDLAQQTMTSVYGTDKLISIESAYGGNGEDTLRGSDGSNNIAGLGGRDALFGAGGNDRIWSGLGKDTTTGGAGDDAFVFFEWGKPYADRVTDFVHGDDKIELAIGTFDALSMGTLKANNFVLGTNAKDSNDFLIYDKGTGKLYYDPDGNGDAGSGLIATFASKPTLTASDIKVVAFTTFNEFWV